MKFNTIEFLKWDSEFFGYEVARIFFDQYGCETLDYLFQQLEHKETRLSYLFVPETNKELNQLIINKGCILVDKKTIYSKTTEKHNFYSNKIIEYQKNEINEKLIELVLEAGSYSRFKQDVNFTNREYERLYIEWLHKSLNKSLALNTFVSILDSGIVGIITLGEKSGSADIGLVAVNKNSRRLGIAKDLIHFADNAASDLGFDNIKVATQFQNIAACKLYEKCNFHIESTINIYHYWQ
jgi:dTDP-4-amino-4,6-dideoxy-D-galactose acyltransferase